MLSKAIKMPTGNTYPLIKIEGNSFHAVEENKTCFGSYYYGLFEDDVRVGGVWADCHGKSEDCSVVFKEFDRKH